MLAVIIEVFQVEKGSSVTFQKKPFSALGGVEEKVKARVGAQVPARSPRQAGNGCQGQTGHSYGEDQGGFVNKEVRGKLVEVAIISPWFRVIR